MKHNRIKQTHFSSKRVILTILTIVILLVFVPLIAFRTLFGNRSFTGRDTPNRRGQALLQRFQDTEDERNRVTAESYGALWFSALSAGNRDKVTEPLRNAATKKDEELAKLEPYLGQKWAVEFPATIVTTEQAGTVFRVFQMSAKGTSKDGKQITLTIEVDASERYEWSSMVWSATPAP